MLAAKSPSISRFKGLNNVSDPLRLGLDWLTLANNVHITDTGALERRAGYSQSMAGSLTGAYATADEARLYVVDGGALKAMAGANAAVTLRPVSALPMFWTEANNQVFYNNGVERGIIGQDNALLDWTWPVPATPQITAATGQLDAGTYWVCCTFTLADGRETGNSDPAAITLADGQALQLSGIPLLPGGITNVYIASANSTFFQLAWTTATLTAFTWNAPADNLGPELLTENFEPLPAGADVVQFWKGRIYAAQYFAADDQTAIWVSQPLGFHLFNLNTDFVILPGQVRMLAPTDDALIIGTDKGIHAYTGDGTKKLAGYGVVAGQHWAKDGDQGEASRILFWSVRGLCAALPFSNLTEKQVSVAPGVMAGGTIVREGGQKRYLVAIQQGGTAFNPL